MVGIPRHRPARHPERLSRAQALAPRVDKVCSDDRLCSFAHTRLRYPHRRGYVGQLHRGYDACEGRAPPTTRARPSRCIRTPGRSTSATSTAPIRARHAPEFRLGSNKGSLRCSDRCLSGRLAREHAVLCVLLLLSHPGPPGPPVVCPRHRYSPRHGLGFTQAPLRSWRLHYFW